MKRSKETTKATFCAGHVTQKTLARLFGVDVRTVQRWTGDGMPRKEKAGRSVFYDVAACIAWRRKEDRKGVKDEAA